MLNKDTVVYVLLIVYSCREILYKNHKGHIGSENDNGNENVKAMNKFWLFWRVASFLLYAMTVTLCYEWL